MMSWHVIITRIVTKTYKPKTKDREMSYVIAEIVNT